MKTARISRTMLQSEIRRQVRSDQRDWRNHYTPAQHEKARARIEADLQGVVKGGEGHSAQEVEDAGKVWIWIILGAVTLLAWWGIIKIAALAGSLLGWMFGMVGGA